MKIAGKILVVDADEVSSFITRMVFENIELPHAVTSITGMKNALDYLRQTYPMGGSFGESCRDIVILGNSLYSGEFMEELEKCRQIDRSRFSIVALTHLFSYGEYDRLSKYALEAFYPEMLSKELINKILANHYSDHLAKAS